MPFLIDCTCSFKLGLRPSAGTGHASRCAYVLWLSIATAIVTIGGLAAVSLV